MRSRRCRRSSRCFNGATARRPWTAVLLDEAAKWRIMLQWGHGPKAVDGDEPCHAFGALGQLQWGHGPKAVDGGRRPAGGGPAGWGFNGATARRPWTGRQIGLYHSDGVGLQWGHGPKAVDGSRPPRCASRPTCFNGATARRPWTDRRRARPRVPRHASMGPRPEGRGRRTTAKRMFDLNLPAIAYIRHIVVSPRICARS